MKRPLWHGVKPGDSVRFRGGRVWYRVERVPPARGVAPEFRTIDCVHPRAKRMRRDRRYISGWLTEIAAVRRC